MFEWVRQLIEVFYFLSEQLSGEERVHRFSCCYDENKRRKKKKPTTFAIFIL